MKKKLLSMLLVLVMLLGMLPMGALAAETELSFSGDTITLAEGTMIGSATLKSLQIYKQNAYPTAPTIVKATQDGLTINVVLDKNTDLSYPLQCGFATSAPVTNIATNKCTLSNGSGTMNVELQLKAGYPANAAVLGQGTVTVNVTVERGASYNVTSPSGEGFAFTGDSVAYEGSPYTFQIAVNEGYDGSNMVVRVNGTEIEGSNGSYTVENVTEDLTITVEGVVAKEVCTITPPEAEGITFTGAANVYKGDSYSFTIAVDGAYDASNMVVKAGETELTGSNGKYTIAAVNEDTAITVTGVAKKNTYTVTLTEGAGYTISGQSTSYAGEPYTFTVTVDDDIYFADQIVVMVNGETVALTEGKYTIAALDGDKTVTVDNVKERELYTVEKTGMDGVTITGADNVREGKPYTFSVAVDTIHYISADMVVKVNGDAVALTDGSYTINAAGENIAITVEGVVRKNEYTVTKPEVEGVTVTGADTVLETDSYTFSVAVDEAYDASGMVVKVNGDVVALTDGSYTIPSVVGNVEISVEGVSAREVCHITAPTGKGFTFTGEESAYKGGNYSFSVSAKAGYDATNMVVTVNGDAVTGSNGTYTVSVNSDRLVIAVEGLVRAVLPETELTVTKEDDAYKVDVRNNELKAFSNCHATVTDIKISGVQVTAAYESGTTVYFMLHSTTPDTAELAIEFLYTKNDCTLKGNTTSVTLEDGEGGKVHRVTADYSDGWRTKSADYTLIFFREIPATNPPARVQECDEKTLWGGENWEINLESYFTDADTYYLVDGETSTELPDGKYLFNNSNAGEYTLAFKAENVAGLSEAVTVTVVVKAAERLQENDTISTYVNFPVEIDVTKYFDGASIYYLVDGDERTELIGGKFTFDATQEAGTYTLVFVAENAAGVSEPVTVTVTVAAIESGAWLGITTSKGSVNSVQFKDESGELIEGLTASLEGNEIIVSVPRTFAANGKITACFDLTQTGDFPFLTTKTGTSGTTSNKAVSNKFTSKTTTLSSGTGALTFYLYNYNPSTTSNSYSTYKLKYAIQNEVPVLAENHPATGEASITADQNYELDLDGIFVDPDDGDTITGWKVSVNGAAATNAEVDENNVYSFSTDTAGEYTLAFYALDNYNVLSAATYTVTLTVENVKDTFSMTVAVPESLSPQFYVSPGFDSDGVDLQGDSIAAVAGTATNGMTVYTLNYPKNVTMLSVRDENWGGIAFEAVRDGSVTLRNMELSTVDYNNTVAESSKNVKYDGHTAAAGNSGWLLVCGTEYTITATPVDTATLAAVTEKITLAVGADVYSCEIMLGINNPLTITVTTGAKAQLYKYNKYYSSTELDAKIVKNNGDGTTTYSFIANTKDSHASFMYHISMEGKITKAGWIAWGVQNLTMLHSDNDKANTWRLDNYAAAGQNNSGVTEDSVLLNINSRNHLNLTVGQAKTLKAYRAWEIIKTSSDNHILTPDFTYTILSGSDVVSLTKKSSPSTADGDWMTLTALKEGTAIIEVTYDAMEVSGGSYDGTYGASDPNRSGFVVVTVGGCDESVNFGIDCFSSIGIKGSNNTAYNPNNKKAWDAEFDTLYFTEDSGTLNFKPSAGSTITEVAVSNDKGANWTTLTAVDGVYTATIVPGNNILRINTTSGVAYQIVRGDKVTVKLVEVPSNSDEDGIIEAGETVRITLVGLHAPIPKMAGNYNPGYRGNYDGYSSQHINYTANGTSVYGSGAQYNFITAANYVQVVMPQDGSDVTLTDGYIGLGVIGLTNFADGGDSHRNIPDEGCATRDNQSTWHTRSILPEITIEAGAEAAANTPPCVRGDAPTTATLELSESIYTYAINLATAVFTDPDQADTLTYTVKVNEGEAAPVSAGYYTLVRPEVGTFTLLFTVSDGKASAEHTIELTVTEAKTSDPELGDGEDKEDEHVVYVSFVDFATRVVGESNVEYPNQLGTIVPRTAVPYTPGDTIADVTLRLLDSKGMTYAYSGSPESGFYLSKIGNFSAGGIPVDEFGEFDAGNGSGWMITQNGVFIGQGASEFVVTDGDVIEWQYTCQLGKDIGDPYWDDEDAKDKDDGKDDIEADVQVSVSGNTATVDKVVLPEADSSTDAAAGNIVLDFSEVESSQPITTVAIPSDIVKQIADASGEAQKLEIVLTGGAAIELDVAALSEKASKTGGSDVKVSIENTSNSLVGAQKETVGSRPAYDIKITSGGKNISDMGKPITVYVPYTLRTGEKARGLVVFYVDDNGNKERCVTSYDAANKRVKWNTDHLSVYMIDYDEKLASNPFDDVSDSAYYYDAVLWAYDSGITSGTSDTTFSPDASCTRAQMVTFLWRAAGKPEAKVKTHSFTDVDESAYYYEALLWAVENGITSGTSATTFSPDAACTRGQMAAFLYRSAKSPAVSGTHAFTDVAADAYYNKAVIWAAAEGITSGTSATTFSPDANCTRGQMAAFLYRYLAK